MQRHVKTVCDALNRNLNGPLPRGELFIGADFMEQYFPLESRFNGKQLRAAAEELGLSLVGIDLNSKRSLSLLASGGYRDLDEYFTVACVNGPVARLIDNHGFYSAMISIKKKSYLDKRDYKNLTGGYKHHCKRSGRPGH